MIGKLVAAATALIIGCVAVPAVSTSHTRVVEVRYRTPMFRNDIPGMLDCLAAADAGCIRIPVRSGEKYVHVSLKDSVGPNVAFSVDNTRLYCNESPRVFLGAGSSDILVYVEPTNRGDTCSRGAMGTTGVITATFGR